MMGIRPSRFFWSLMESPRATVPEMLQRTSQYITVEAMVEEKHKDQKQPWVESSWEPPSGLPRRRMERVEQTVPRLPNTPLNSTRIEIFLQLWEKGLLKAPNPMRTRSKERDHERYCCFHCDYGHDTEECYDLKNQIEDLIRLDHLDWYVRKLRKPSLRPKGPVERQINVIVGGPITRGDSSSTRKAYA
ncbi:hypothetical protein BHE74_00022248 [Ensete ventricosum]|nr:hypothetical protein BHE74_00022248 [Ensete ventricosum]